MQSKALRRRVNVVIGVLGNFVLPWALYRFCEARFGATAAIYIAAIVPALWGLVEYARTRKVDAMSAISLAGIALSLVAVAFGGSPKMLLLRESLVIGVIGLIFLGSAAIGRPLFYELVKIAYGKAERDDEHESIWTRARAEVDSISEEPLFREMMTVMTGFIGLIAVAETAVLCLLVLRLPSDQFLLVRPVVRYCTAGVILAFAILYCRPMLRKIRSVMKPSVVPTPSE